MRQSRFNALYQGLTATAKKVFAVVPIAEQWSPAQIVAELRRQGSSVDFRVIAGCIAALVSSGLVVEGRAGLYARVKVNEAPAKVPEQAGEQVVNTTKESQVAQQTISQDEKKHSAITKLGALAERALAIGLMLKTLGDDITKAAIEIDDEAAEREAATGKMRQLQQLLKEIGG